jgi:predicted MFS family arabinose efflux permease
VSEPVSESVARDDRATSVHTTLVVLSAAVFMMNFDSRAVIPLLPNIAEDLGVETAAVGLAVTAYMIPYGLFQLAYGPIGDRFGRLFVARATLGLFCLAVGACALAPTIEWLWLLRFLTGCAAAALFPMSLAYVGDAFDYDDRPAAIGTLMTATSSSMLIAVSAAGVIAGLVGWRPMYALTGILAALVFVALLRIQPPRVETQRTSPLAGYRRVLTTPAALGLIVLGVIEGAFMMGTISYIGAYLRDVWDLPYAAIGVILIPNGIAALVVSRYLGALARRYSESARFAVGMAVCGVCYALFALDAGWWIVPVGLFAIGAAFVAAHAVLQARVTEAVPGLRGTSIAVFACSLFVGGSIGTAGMGAVITFSGYAVAFVVTAIGFALLVLAGLIVLRKPVGGQAAGSA